MVHNTKQGGIKGITATASTISSIPKQFLGHVNTLILDRPYVVGFCALSIAVDFMTVKILKILKN